MRRLVLALALAAILAPAVRAARDEAAGEAGQPNIQQLIADLGSDRYAVRLRAEAQLLQMGPEAFDELKNAENSQNLEVAERVRYIVQKMHVQWLRADDPAEVRRVLAHYGDLSEDARNDRIRQLANLDEHAGLAALCRIARFDQSPLVARRAAITMLKVDLTAEERHAATPAWQHELGTSDRPPAHWVRLYLRELDAPANALAEWATANAAEAALFKAKSSDTNFMNLQSLLVRQLERCDKLKLEAETTAALLAIVDMTAGDHTGSEYLNRGLDWALRWVIRHKRWDVLKSLDAQFESQFRSSRLLLYDLAAAADKAGEADRAASLAEQAYNLPESVDPLGDGREGLTIAETIAKLGRVDWAVREYRRIIEDRPVIDRYSMDARSDLAMWLHDGEKYQEAADVLGEFCDAIDADRIARQKLVEELDATNGSGGEMVREITARREFYLACVEEAREDYVQQRKHLEEAIKKYDKDPDILIAMYRSPGADDDFRRRTKARIRVLSNYMKALVEEYPDAPSVYNQWAWLIANTEGEQQKAVQYSLRSLELSPEEPSYLDTLGRCYYAVGEYKKAAESQRRAVELAPQYGVMKRQLAQFEKTLAEKGDSVAPPETPGEGASSSDPPPSSPRGERRSSGDEDSLPLPEPGPAPNADPFG